MATSRSDGESSGPPPGVPLSEDEVVAIAAFLLFERHESAARYGRISPVTGIGLPEEESDG